jgi:alcohol dehydrogenase class IV
VDAGAAHAAPSGIDLIVGLGGGTSLDCAKAINLALTNADLNKGGRIADYRGYGKATRPLHPMIAVPTSAGTGSESQSDVWLVDSAAKARINVGDLKMTYRVALLDPKLTLTQPPELAAASGYDAISRALETLWSSKRTPISECFSREAWRLLDGSFTRSVRVPEDLEARGAVQLGAHLAGLAAEYSSLGAAHALARSLAANCGLRRGAAHALMLPHVVRWYSEALAKEGSSPGISVNGTGAAGYAALGARLRDLAAAAELPQALRDTPVPESVLPRLAEEAAAEWSARFSPRALDAVAALELYQAAW